MSRAYYSAFGYSFQYATQYLGFVPRVQPEEKAQDHGRLRAHLAQRRRRQVAETLDDLRQWRNACDYVSDLIGCVLFDGEREIGKIEDVQFSAGEAPLLILRNGEKEYEIPYAEAYLTGVEMGRKMIRMALPEGMLEVNAPLTPEEKRHQAGERRRK